MPRLVPADLDDPRVVALLQGHLDQARRQTAPGSAHALDLSGLRARDISAWTLWHDDELAAIGALKTLSSEHGEVKSMHTVAALRRRGAGRAMLRHLIDTAHARGYVRLSLETGSWDYFRPAHALYRGHGFVDCPPFGNYLADPNSIFMTLELPPSRA
jgi:putative acetyltransferase